MQLEKSFSGSLKAQTHATRIIAGLAVVGGMGVLAVVFFSFSVLNEVGPLAGFLRSLPDWVTSLGLLVCTIGGIGGFIVGGVMLPVVPG